MAKYLKKTSHISQLRGVNMAKRGDSGKCYSCSGKMEKGVELIITKGKTIPQEILKCTKCGKGIVSSDEYERVRKELHPSIFSQIKNIFKADTECVEIFKGKVL